MKRFDSYRNRIITAAAVMLAAGLAGAAPASAAPRNFPAAQLITEINPQPQRCLDVDAGTEGNVRTNVQLYDCRDANDFRQGYQIFDQQSIPGRPFTEFKLRNQHTGKCLTYNVHGANGSPVWAQSCDQFGQGWTRETTSTGFDQYVAVETDRLCLDVVNPDGHLRDGIDLFFCNGQPYNTWLTL